MEEEHCVKAGCDDEFVTSNYGIRTTLRKEYEIATGRRACPPGDMLDKKGRKIRVVRRIEELKGLKLVQRAGLEEAEILAVVRALDLRCVCSAHLQYLYALPAFVSVLTLFDASRCCTLGPCSRCCPAASCAKSATSLPDLFPYFISATARDTGLRAP
jgi:hypothetical protein